MKGSVYLKPIDIEDSKFGGSFDLSVLDKNDCPESSTAREVVIKVFQQMIHLGNSHLNQNADVWLSSKRDRNQDVLWPRERISEGKFALIY